MRVDDGLGSGRQAAVGSDNRLLVQSAAASIVAVQSEAGKAFAYSTDFRIPNTTNEVGMFLLTGQAELTHVNFMRLCSMANARWRIYKNVVGLSGTTFATETARNLNFGSGSVFKGSVQRWSAGTSIAMTGGEFIGCLVTGAFAGGLVEGDDAIILTPTNNILITVQPAAASATDGFSVTSSFYEHEGHQ